MIFPIKNRVARLRQIFLLSAMVLVILNYTIFNTSENIYLTEEMVRYGIGEGQKEAEIEKKVTHKWMKNQEKKPIKV